MAINEQRLGEVLSSVRRARGLTQREVAARADLTVNYLSLVENGARGLSTAALNRVADVYGVPAEVLLFLAGDGELNHENAEAFRPLFRETTAALREFLGLDEGR